MKLHELFEAGAYKIDWNRVARDCLPLLILANDIRENGIKEPILLKDGKVADGIHRMFALWLSNYEGDIPVKNLDA
jgi:ParB-like chromosome segregation protein Spo0J|tara:strand:+ start:267 stop:494 length:228 start_codon:yes stop_codon:yes gene_type:complete